MEFGVEAPSSPAKDTSWELTSISLSSVPAQARSSARVINVRYSSKLQQLNHNRSVLLALVSHELQTPIAIIKAYANTLARADQGGARCGA